MIERKPERGFSLIEIMVVVAILGILTAAAAPNLIDLIRNARVAGEGRSLYGGLLDAQGQAMASGSARCLSLDLDANTWSIRRDTDNDGDCDVASTPHRLAGDNPGTTNDAGFAPSGYPSAFPAPFASIPRGEWCSFAGGTDACEVIFASDGTATLSPDTGETSGSVAIFSTGAATSRYTSVVVVAATGLVRLYSSR